MVVGVIGTGYVGLTTACVLASVGIKTYCLDIDLDKIEKIKSGKSFFYEPGIEKLINEGLESGNLIPTTDYSVVAENIDIGIICVGTPANSDGSSNIQYVLDAGRTIVAEKARSSAGASSKDLILVIKSTVPVGTSARLRSEISEFDVNVDILMNPEFLAEGSAIYDSYNFDRIVVGGEREDIMDRYLTIFEKIDEFAKENEIGKIKNYGGVYRKKFPEYYLQTFAERVLKVNLESAELIKVTANAYLATKISFANSIARICDVTGAKVNEIMDGIGMDGRIGRDFLYAGLGWGGGCFPKDVSGLIDFASKKGVEMDILKSASKLNFQQPLYLIEKIEKNILDSEGYKGKQVGVLGLAFKPGTSDVRLSPSLEIIQNLLTRGAIVRAHDPQAIEESKNKIPQTDSLTYYEDIDSVITGVDILIIATDWPEFLKIDLNKIKNKMKGDIFVDARNRFNSSEVEAAGLTYISMGN